MFLLYIPLFYFLTRGFTVFYWSLTWPGYSLEDAKVFYHNPGNFDHDLPGLIFLPIVGELIFICLVLKILFWHPMFWFQNFGYFLRNRAAERKDLVERRKKYLDNLARFGLSPKDIPAYIRNPKNLDEFLDVWKKHKIIE